MEQTDIEQEKVIREIEKQIDTYFKNLDHFKNDKRALIFETINCLQSYIHTFKMAEENNPLSTMIHLRRVVNTVNKMIEGILSFSNYNDNKDINIAELFFECENYNFICDAFIAYSRGLYDAKYDETKNRLTFSFKKNSPFSKRIFISDDVERMYEKAMAVYHGAKLIEADMRTVHPKGSPPLELNEETFQFVMELVEPFLDKAVSRHFDTQTQLPTDWNLIGFTMDEYRVGWCAITKATLKKIGADYLKIFQKKDFATYMRYKVADLIMLIQDNILSVEKAERILNLLIYNPELNNNSVLYQPLFSISEDEVIFAPSLFSEFIPQDNFIAVINKINNKLYNQLSNQKEDFLIEELNNLLAKHNGVLFKDKIKLPNNLPDIDYLIFDQNTNTVFIIELKFLLKANNLKEKFARDSEIQNGIEQIIKYKDYVSININQIINSHLHITPNVKNICFFLLSKNGIYSGNYSMEIPVISQIMFQRLLMISEYNFEMVFKNILERSYLPNEQIVYTEDTDEFVFGEINFSIPSLNPTIIPEMNQLLVDSEHLQHSRKIGRNALCPCGSGIKYKKCCGRVTD